MNKSMRFQSVIRENDESRHKRLVLSSQEKME